MFIKRLQLLTSNLLYQRDFYSTVLELPATLENDALHIQAGKTELIFNFFLSRKMLHGHRAA